jgi:predicted amino acid-binding ACT domain protein
MNKSEISRNFWRQIFDENKIDLRNSDKRNAAVNEFLENPQNIKAGWKKADRRFFRLSLDKIFRERGISSHSKNIKPITQTAQKQAGSMRMNIKTDEKKVHTTQAKPITTQELQQTGQEAKQQAAPEQQAAYYTAENVAVIFDTMFNLLHARYPACSKLSPDEKSNIGESWRPIFDKYLADKGGIWIAPILATVPILLVRVAEYNRELKSDEMKKDFFPNDKDKDDKKDKRTGDDYLGGR